MAIQFTDRQHAGRLLAARLQRYRTSPPPIVLALPRGGVPVAHEVARELGAPLDVFVVRKLGAPLQPELAMGAVASGGTVVINHDIVTALGISDSVITAITEQQRHEIRRREKRYRGDRPPLDLGGRTVLLIDDGLATGATMEAAISAVRSLEPNRLVVAVPTAPADTARRIATMVDDFVCIQMPEPFGGVGRWYQDFTQTTDAEVVDLLNRSGG